MKKYLFTSLVIVFGLLLANVAQATTQYPPTVNISAQPATGIPNGGSTTISWNSQNADTCTASEGSPGWSGSKNTSGSYPASNLTSPTYRFKIKCTNSSGSVYDYVDVTVNQNSNGNGGCGSNCGGCGSNCGTSYPPTVDITASPNIITSGDSSFLSWKSTNAVSCTPTNSSYGWSGNINTSGGTSVSPNTTTSYGITCYNSKGQTASDSVTVTVKSSGCGNNCGNNNNNCGNNCGNNNGCGNNCYTPPAPIITSFYASRTSINKGESSIIYWNSANASNCNADNYSYGNWFGSIGTSGSTVVDPDVTTTYNLTCYNSQGQRASSNLTISVNNNTYTNVTTNSASSVTENSAILNGYVTTSGSNIGNMNRWFEWGTSSGNLYNRTNSTYGGSTFSQFISGLSPNTTYYFRAAANGTNGNVYGTILSFSTSGNTNTCGNGIACPPTAITNSASNIGQTSARLNGTGIQDGISYSMNGYFEWGSTASLGNNTTSGYIGSTRSNPFYSSLFDLSPGTRYYYRAVVTNSYGTVRGDIRSFVTNSINTVTPVVRPPVVTPVVITNAVPSSIFLDIDRDDGTIRLGDTIDYNVTWRNITGNSLSNVVIHVLVPNELEFIRASRGDLSEDNRYVVLTLGSLQAGEQGGMVLTVRVRTASDIGSTVVVTAEAEYTLPSGAQEKAFAYSKNTVENGSGVGLAGLALFGDGFWPSTLLGWLLLLLILLIIIWVARTAYTKTMTRAPTPPNNTPWNPHA